MIASKAAFIEQLFPVFKTCWAADTSATPEAWTSDNPALGQCAVTALVVQDYCGGLLLTTTYEGQSHYWNLISHMPFWLEADLTRIQFPDLTGPMPNPQLGDRDYVLSYDETVRRYQLLASRVGRYVHVR